MQQIIITLSLFITLISSSYAGGLYNCIDSGGNKVLTNIPHEGMKCDLISNDSDKKTLHAEQARQRYEQIEKTKPMVIKTPKGIIRVPNYMCIQEYKDGIDNKCVEDIQKKIRSSLSPHCRELVESSHKEEEQDKGCLKEVVMGTNRMFREIEKCNKLPVDSKCREQIQSAIRERLREATKKALN